LYQYHGHTERFVITGPPRAGKTTLLEDITERGDFVWDLDRVVQAVTFHDRDTRPDWALDFVLGIRKGVINHALEHLDIMRVFVVNGTPNTSTRAKLLDQTKGFSIVLKPKKQEVLERCNRERLVSVIEDWYESYEKQEYDYEVGEEYIWSP
jgi:adenylate kinase family enzyme